jgi:FtsH-binding integral membrane protein
VSGEVLQIICSLVIVACSGIIYWQTRKVKKMAEENLKLARENLQRVYAKYGIDPATRPPL